MQKYSTLQSRLDDIVLQDKSIVITVLGFYQELLSKTMLNELNSENLWKQLLEEKKSLEHSLLTHFMFYSTATDHLRQLFC